MGALLNPKKLEAFITEKLQTLGTSACPPYHIALVVGGTSAEACLKTVKLASAKYYDDLPTSGSEGGRAFRDLEWEEKVNKICQDRQILAKITAEGVLLEQLEHEPSRFLVSSPSDLVATPAEVVSIDLELPMEQILATLTKYPIKTRLKLTGTLIVARDIAHAKLNERLEATGTLPDYVKNHPIYYAGPAKTPQGYASGSFGPTTAGRMDTYVPIFQPHGTSLITLAKGNRSKQVTDSCAKHGGFYLGSIGGAAAVLASDNIKKVEVLDFEDQGVEAVWKIEVEDFPAFILCGRQGQRLLLK